MIYSISYHSQVKQDFLQIDPYISKDIQRIMTKKLSLHPLGHGAYLHGPLRLYRKLRIREYRVVYRAYQKEVIVYVIAVGYRRNNEVYKKALQKMLH